jgi:hypothetical protein
LLLAKRTAVSGCTVSILEGCNVGAARSVSVSIVHVLHVGFTLGSLFISLFTHPDDFILILTVVIVLLLFLQARHALSLNHSNGRSILVWHFFTRCGVVDRRSIADLNGAIFVRKQSHENSTSIFRAVWPNEVFVFAIAAIKTTISAIVILDFKSLTFAHALFFALNVAAQGPLVIIIVLVAVVKAVCTVVICGSGNTLLAQVKNEGHLLAKENIISNLTATTASLAHGFAFVCKSLQLVLHVSIDKSVHVDNILAVAAARASTLIAAIGWAQDVSDRIDLHVTIFSPRATLMATFEEHTVSGNEGLIKIVFETTRRRDELLTGRGTSLDTTRHLLGAINNGGNQGEIQYKLHLLVIGKIEVDI